MTPRERLMAALRGDSTDRVPVWLLYPYHPIGCYVDARSHPSYAPVAEMSRRYAITLDRRVLSAPLFSPEVSRGHETVERGGVHIRREFLSYKGRRLVAETRRGQGGSSATKLLTSAADLEFYCSLPVETDRAAIEAALDRRLPSYLRERDEFPRDLGAMMLALGEPVGQLYQASTTEEYAIWSLTHDGIIRTHLDRVMERLRLIYRYCLERDLADVYFLVGSELASPPLVSRATFRRWVVPYASALIEMVHRYGKKVIQHYHGQVREILPDFLEMRPDGLHTIEAPPVGNCTMRQAYELVGDAITLIGNVQYDCFRSYTPEEMTDAVRALVEECRGRRFILSPTAGPFDPDPPAGVIENYRVFMRTAWECPWAPARRERIPA